MGTYVGTVGVVLSGCLLAAAITFPLVFGWIHFSLDPGDFDHYRVMVFGFETFSFPIESLLGALIFHGLVWSAFLVIAGLMLAMRRRMRDRDAAALQQFGEDLMPLVLLFAISITGLMLVVSYEWMRGYGYEFLSILHAAVVIITLVWLPFGKFFHIFMRPAQLGVSFYKDAGERMPQAKCARCGGEYASQMHVEDLMEVQRQLAPPYWINMGAMAISTLAGAVLASRAGDSRLLAELLPFIKGLTLLFWATATWWIPLLVALGVWRHTLRKVPLTYDVVYWSAVFPLGMYTVCTHRLTEMVDLPYLAAIPKYFFFVALAAWALTFAGLVWRCGRYVSAALMQREAEAA